MRKQFSGYYTPTDQEFGEIWETGTFFFDANSLLNLYGYTKQSREDMLNSLRRIADRTLIPHQVALEYQENRINRIAEQKNLFTKVKAIVENNINNLKSQIENLQLEKRHSTINTTNFLKELDKTYSTFITTLENLEESQKDVHEVDEVRKFLDEILGNNVCKPLKKEDLENLYKNGEERYKRGQPPGYMDFKSKKNESDYHYNELIIKRAFGDLIIWEQIISESNKRGLKAVIFITDEKKEDWLWKHSGKSLGPRPELIHEIKARANVSHFWIYSSERFLKYANRYLDLSISDDSISQIREAIELREDGRLPFSLSQEDIHLLNSYGILAKYKLYKDSFIDLVVVAYDTFITLNEALYQHSDIRTSLPSESDLLDPLQNNLLASAVFSEILKKSGLLNSPPTVIRNITLALAKYILLHEWVEIIKRGRRPKWHIFKSNSD